MLSNKTVVIPVNAIIQSFNLLSENKNNPIKINTKNRIDQK
jgi:hypothetical protein